MPRHLPPTVLCACPLLLPQPPQHARLATNQKQAALDAMEAYYVKVKTEQRLLQDRVTELEGVTQNLQGQLTTLEAEHALCADAKWVVAGGHRQVCS